MWLQERTIPARYVTLRKGVPARCVIPRKALPSQLILTVETKASSLTVCLLFKERFVIVMDTICQLFSGLRPIWCALLIV